MSQALTLTSVSNLMDALETERMQIPAASFQNLVESHKEGIMAAN